MLQRRWMQTHVNTVVVKIKQLFCSYTWSQTGYTGAKRLDFLWSNKNIFYLITKIDHKKLKIFCGQKIQKNPKKYKKYKKPKKSQIPGEKGNLYINYFIPRFLLVYLTLIEFGTPKNGIIIDQKPQNFFIWSQKIFNFLWSNKKPAYNLITKIFNFLWSNYKSNGKMIKFLLQRLLLCLHRLPARVCFQRKSVPRQAYMLSAGLMFSAG